MSVSFQSIGFKEQNELNSIPLSSSVIEMNVDNIQKARVKVYLASHGTPEHLIKLANIIKSFNPSTNDIGLWENSINHSPAQLFPHLSLKWKEWEDPEVVTLFKPSTTVPPITDPIKANIIAKLRKQDQMLHSWKDLIGKLGSTTTDIENQKETVKTILAQAGRLQLSIDVSFEKVLKYVTCPNAYQKKLEATKQNLSKLLDRIYDEYTKQINEKLFSYRQTSLINCIAQHLTSENTIHVICGKSHAKMENSPFPEDTQRLITFLRAKTSFAIIDL